MSKLKPQKVDWKQIERFLGSADQKLATAEKILAIDEEVCLQQAYEAMLRSSIGFMLCHGVRVRSQTGHHIAIIGFVEKISARSMQAWWPYSTGCGDSEIGRSMTRPGLSPAGTQRKP